MKRFILTPTARRDLNAIWDYLCEQVNERLANRILAELYDAIQLLAENPGFGHTRADVYDPNYRFWSVHRYVIAYRTDLKPLTVARVVHGARDFKKLFQ